MKLIWLLPLMFVTTASASEIACSNPESRQFDFWLGDWRVEQRISDGEGDWIELGATTSVSREAAGCALVERWSGSVQFAWAGMEQPEAMSGLSVRYFHPKERQWHIHWLDSRNPAFGDPFKGGFDEGVGRFYLTRNTEAGPRRSRITFEQPAQDRVRWELALEREPGEWTTFWIMDMHRIATGDVDQGS